MRFVVLNNFLETVRLGSIRRASEELHIAPSALSRQIALLEADFGSALFERMDSGMRVTAAGELFARQARATLRDFERLHSDMDDLQQLRRGNVRVSSMELGVPGVLMSAMHTFCHEHPNITFDIVVAGSELQIIALAQQEFDISLVFDPSPHPDVVVECAVSDPICAIVHPDHPLAVRQYLDLKDLAGQRLAFLPPAFVTRTRLDQAAIRDRVALSPALTFNHISHTLDFARQAMGVAFAPGRAVRNELQAKALVALPIDNSVLAGATTALCRHRSRSLSRAAEAFMAVLRSELLGDDEPKSAD